MNKKESKLELLLLDILRGYSKFTYKSKTYYLRHSTVFNCLELEEYQSECLDSALKRGIKSEDQLLEIAIDRKSWSTSDDDKIKNLKWIIEKSESAASKIADNISRKSFEDSILKDKKELNELESRRFSLIAHSAESFAMRKKNYKELSSNLFEDLEMKKEICHDDIFLIMDQVNSRLGEINNYDNMIKMSYHYMFFDVYSLMYRQPHEMIGKNIYNITNWQKTLLSCSSVILSKLKNYDMPDHVANDPIKIYKYTPKEDNASSGDNKVTHGLSDLREKMAQKQGKLTAEDF
jgi:hypothetical protein